MPTLKISVEVEQDGRVLPQYSRVKRLSVDEVQNFVYDEADDADATTFSALPADQIAEIQVLYFTADQQLTLRLDGATDAGITVNAGGLVLLMDVDIDAGAGSSNAKVNNNSGSASEVTGFAGGT